MLKKRLIFVLYFDAGFFFLSRNFRLQRVGDVKWLIDKFRFKTIGTFIDEIVILDVTRNSDIKKCDGEKFNNAVNELMKENFVPLTLGGGLRTVEDAKRCFALGADKILLNSSAIQNPDFVKECVALFGAQAVVGGIDIIKEANSYRTKIENAQTPALLLNEHLGLMDSLGVGEVFINSIDRDGTGVGFDLEILKECHGLKTPLILCGGAGKPEHFVEALSAPNVEAAATGNLFNFMGKGFESSRETLVKQGFPIRKF